MKKVLLFLVLAAACGPVFPVRACENPVVTFTGEAQGETGYRLWFEGYTERAVMSRAQVFIDGQASGLIVPQQNRPTEDFPADYPAQLDMGRRSEFVGKVDISEDGQFRVRIRTQAGQPKRCQPDNDSVTVSAYTFGIRKAFWSSDSGITLKVAAMRHWGPDLRSCPNGTPVCNPHYIALRVGGQLVSSMLYAADANNPQPYLLYNLFSDEYAEIAGQTLDAIFYVTNAETKEYRFRTEFPPMPVWQ